MPVINVTDELINIIKAERKERKLKSTELASKLKKNTSFISQLENGVIKELDLNLFFKIFETLIPDDKNRSEFVNNLLQKFSVKLTDEEIKKQIWMATFDLQYRLIVIPDGIIKFIENKISEFKKRKISSKDIIEKVNANEGVDSASLPEENKVYVEYDEKNDLSFSIKFKLSDDIIDEIINGKLRKINYVNLLGIVNTIYKLDGYTDEEAVKYSRELLYKNKFYTLIEKNKIIRRKNNDDLNEDDRKFMKLKKDLIGIVNFLADKDVEYVNEQLPVFCNNLENEPSLTLALIGIPLSELSEIDKSHKKNFMNEFKEMVQKYKNSSTNTVIERLV